MIITLLIVLSITVYYLLQRNGKIRTQQTTFLYETKWMRIALIFTIIIGYWGSMDYNDEWGCLVQHESIFQKYEIYLSAISLLLISMAAFVKSNKLKLTLHVIEAIYWISKLILFKGGYAVGIFGVPDELNLLFDFISLGLRLIILRNLAFTMRTSYILLIAYAFVVLKWILFPMPVSQKWEQQLQQHKMEGTWNKLQGEWVGQRVYETNIADTIYPKHVDSAKMTLLDAIHSKDPLVKAKVTTKIEQVRISVNSNTMHVISTTHETNYVIELLTNTVGSLYEILPDTTACDTLLMNALKTKHKIRQDNGLQRSLYIQKLEEDSLVFTRGITMMRYRLRRVK